MKMEEPEMLMEEEVEVEVEGEVVLVVVVVWLSAAISEDLSLTHLLRNLLVDGGNLPARTTTIRVKVYNDRKSRLGLMLFEDLVELASVLDRANNRT